MFMRLALLPINRIETGFEVLINYINANEQLACDFKEFILYFKITWFKRYSKNDWCVSGRNRRTNNALEGYNNKIKLEIQLHPSPWVFLESILDLAHKASASLENDQNRELSILADRSDLSMPLALVLSKLEEGSINEFEFIQKLAQI